MTRFVIALALVLLAAPAGARSIDDCEAIKDDFKYNECLASFGPKARSVQTRAPTQADTTAKPRQRSSIRRKAGGDGKVASRRERPAAVPGGVTVKRGADGRIQMTFPVRKKKDRVF